MPDDILAALSTDPTPANPGRVQDVHPATGTTVFVNPGTGEVVEVWSASFGK